MEFHKYDRVRFIDEFSSKLNPYAFPPAGTIGIVDYVPDDGEVVRVYWPNEIPFFSQYTLVDCLSIEHVKEDDNE